MGFVLLVDPTSDRGLGKTNPRWPLVSSGLFRPRDSVVFYCENPGIPFDINKPCDLWFKKIFCRLGIPRIEDRKG
jgi:hypothetical protein